MKLRLEIAKTWFSAHKADIALILVLVIVKLVLHGSNLTEYPYYENDEGTYTIRALTFARDGSFDLYTYWYDHAPAGWIFLSGWFQLTRFAPLLGNILNSARLFIFIITTGSLVLTYLIAKRVIRDRLFAFLAALLLVISPLGVYYQRRVLLDNIMIFWVLLSFYQLLGPRLILRNAWLSAISFGIGVLTKLNAAVFLPAFVYLVYKKSQGQSRFVMVSMWLATAGSIILFFPLYALLKGELFSQNPNPETGNFDAGISLVDTLAFQSARGNEDGLLFFEQGSSFAEAFGQWLVKDPALIVFSVCGVVLLGLFASRKFRDKYSPILAVSLALAGMILFIIRGGIVFEFYFLPVLPFAAIAVAFIFYWPTQSRRLIDYSRQWLYRSAIVFVLVVLQIPLLVRDKAIYTDENTNLLNAVAWVQDNLEKDAFVASDNYSLTFLRFEDDFEHVDYNFKYEYDPEIQDKITNDWRNIDYILLTHEVLNKIGEGETPFIKEAYDHAEPVALFAENSTSFVDFDKYVSTNGDWAAIYEVKSDRNIVQQQSYEGFRANNFRSYGQIVEDIDADFASSLYQSNSLIRALNEGNRDDFDGILAWTRDHLQQRQQDSLISGIWEDGQVTDSNPRVLADLEVAYALHRAYDIWDDEQYRDASVELLGDIWEHEVYERSGAHFLVDQALVPLGASDPFVVNPSYGALPYLQYFEDNDTEHDWSLVYETAIDMLERIADEQTGLFPNWVTVNGNGTFSSAESFAENADSAGYESFRISFWLDAVAAADVRAQELLENIGRHYASQYASENFIPAEQTTNGESSTLFDDTLIYASAFFGIESVDGDLAKELLDDKIITNFDSDIGMWAQSDSDFNNQLWLPLLFDQTESVELAPDAAARVAAQ